jgi:hypothetical protein
LPSFALFSVRTFPLHHFSFFSTPSLHTSPSFFPLSSSLPCPTLLFFFHLCHLSSYSVLIISSLHLFYVLSVVFLQCVLQPDTMLAKGFLPAHPFRFLI